MIVLSRSSVAFAQKGGTTTVAVATPSDWKVSCPDDWVTLVSEDGLLTISVTGNTTDDVRSSKIAVETAGDKQEITVHQAFSRETVLLSTTASDEISLDSEGESVLFTVVTNGQWERHERRRLGFGRKRPGQRNGTRRRPAQSRRTPRRDAHRPFDQRLRYGNLQSVRFTNLTRGKSLLSDAGILRALCGKLVLRP